MIITVVAIPVSLVSTLLFLSLFGFSLNVITLFALVLAIGIVVDNAIVVVEAVHQRMTETHESGQTAAEGTTHLIAPAILAITLVMGSVFVPMAFIGGPAGVFYRQFAVTMAVAIALSGWVALTLTPAMCGTLLHHQAHAPNRWLALFEGAYRRFERRFVALTERFGRSQWGTMSGLMVFILATALLARLVPSGFIPAEDQGIFYVSITTPAGATLERTKAVVDAVAAEARQIAEVESAASLSGTNVLSDGTGATYGTVIVNLAPWDERERSLDEVITDLEGRVAGLHAASIEMFPPPPVPGYGNASGFELRFLDKTGSGDVRRMEQVVGEFLQALKARPEIASAFTIFDASYPQYTLKVDIDRAARNGVQLDAALGALQTLLGSEYATNFIRFGQMYKVMVQALPEFRATPEQLLRFQVRNDAGDLIPMSAFLDIEKAYGVDQVTRYNMFPSAEINGEGELGTSSSEVLAAVQETADQVLPKGYGIDWAGVSRDEVEAGQQGLLVGLVALIFVYLVLSAQYESFVLPAAVLLTLPPGVFGALLPLWALGLENNIYAHVALVVLIGLLGKNAVLVVTFAELLVKDGATPAAAVAQAVRQRMRPIVMTSLAFVAGLVPLALASGAGAVANRTIGVATIGGMAFGTVFGMMLVPGLYLACKRLSGNPLSAGGAA